MKKRIPSIVKKIQTTPHNVPDYSFQKTISYSQFSIYNECPHKWKLLYKDGLNNYQPTIHTTFGTAIHNTIQHYLTVMYEQSGAEADRINLEELFEEEFRQTYSKEYIKNKKTHFSNPEEMREFFDDGVEILNYLKKKKNIYFSKRGWYLIKCELPIIADFNYKIKNLLYNGYIDIVLYHEPTDKHLIIDFKTSTRGWNEKAKKDENKQFQILLYKNFYSKQFGINEDNIEVEFVILKRKIFEESLYPQSRIQEYAPPSGKIKMKKATTALDKFLEACFNPDGTYKDVDHPITPNKNCQYCPFDGKKEFCNK